MLKHIEKELRAVWGTALRDSAFHGNEWRVIVPIADFKAILRELVTRKGASLLSFFASDEREVRADGFVLYAILGFRQLGGMMVLRTELAPRMESYLTLLDILPGAGGYEREIHDLFGLQAMGNPDLRPMVHHSNWPGGEYPLRKDFDVNRKPPRDFIPVPFLKVQGEGVFEIPVGPVHAGIIEPGHFRFSVAGEPIINLEAQLYFVHKGIEKKAEGMTITQGLYLSERISGDETFSNALAYCQAVERIGLSEIPKRGRQMRVVFAEIERLTSHLGDLAGICLDVAYGFAAFQYRMMRGWTYLLAEDLCGSRFLRSVVLPGGVRKDFIAGKESRSLEALDRIEKELKETYAITRFNNMFVDRVENTGVLDPVIALDLNATGPGARASGIDYDVRKAFPYADYESLNFETPKHHNGDVNCRYNVKYEECLQAIDLIRQVLNNPEPGDSRTELEPLTPWGSGVGYTESARGENIHWLRVDDQQRIFRYKVRTPSFCTWPAVCYAVRGNIVPDFPLINKSFNLSYAGNDL